MIVKQPAQPAPGEIHMLIECDCDAVRKVKFRLANGERRRGYDPHAAIYQREDGGGWMVGWGTGAAGPFETSQFAQAVAQAMRGETAPT